eukprot:5377663-Amphidinium_carterae.2
MFVPTCVKESQPGKFEKLTRDRQIEVLNALSTLSTLEVPEAMQTAVFVCSDTSCIESRDRESFKHDSMLLTNSFKGRLHQRQSVAKTDRFHTSSFFLLKTGAQQNYEEPTFQT